MAVSFLDRLVRKDDVLFQELDGESVLLHVTRGEYFGLNETGHRMWLLMTESDSIQQAYEKLLEEYDIEPAQLRDELAELADSLVEHGLAEVAA